MPMRMALSHVWITEQLKQAQYLLTGGPAETNQPPHSAPSLSDVGKPGFPILAVQMFLKGSESGNEKNTLVFTLPDWVCVLICKLHTPSIRKVQKAEICTCNKKKFLVSRSLVTFWKRKRSWSYLKSKLSQKMKAKKTIKHEQKLKSTCSNNVLSPTLKRGFCYPKGINVVFIDHLSCLQRLKVLNRVSQYTWQISVQLCVIVFIFFLC